MANLKRVRILWGGTGIVGPGTSTLYFDSTATGFVSALSTMLTAWKTYLPNTTTVHIDNAGETIDMATGSPNGVWTDGSTFGATGNSASTFAAGVGARAVWNTAGFNNGRRVRGSTYIVPLVTTAYNVGGSLEATALSALQSAATAMVTAMSPHFVVYSKGPAGVSAGNTAAVTGAVVPADISWLRSRRT